MRDTHFGNHFIMHKNIFMLGESMVIHETQLEVWSHQGAIQSSEATHQSIRNCINNHNFPNGVRFSIYLQGSYKNSTNIYANSDVDVVIELTSAFRPDASGVTNGEREIYAAKYRDATYGLDDFRADVLNALRNCYDTNKIVEGNKAIRLEGYSGRLNADIVTAMQYRYFWHVHENRDDEYIRGIAFKTRNNVWIYSYPKQHFDNGVKKMSLTNHNFKSLIRIYKNMRAKLEDNSEIPENFITSYFIESLLYNLPNEHFTGSYPNMLYRSLNFFNNTDFNDFKFQHGLYNLFGSSDGQWSIAEAENFISSVIELWNNW